MTVRPVAELAAEVRRALSVNISTTEHREVLAALRELAERAETAERALEVLLDWAEKTKGGYVFDDPSEEWYATRDFARHALAARLVGHEPGDKQ